MQGVKWLEGGWNGRVYWILDHASTETSGGTMRVPEAGSHWIGQGRRDWSRYPQSREGDWRMELMEIWKSRGPLIEDLSACSLLHLEP